MTSQLHEQVTVVIAGSLIRSHPSTKMIRSVIESLGLLGIDDRFRLILAHDAPPPETPRLRLESFEKYLAELTSFAADRGNTRITVLGSWGQLTASLKEAMQYVETKHVLICQHDLMFTRKIDLRAAVWLLDQKQEVKHIRFNLQKNKPYAFDASPRTRLRGYSEERFSMEGEELRLTKTLGWSDNNHLTSKAYYQNLVFPMVGSKSVPPEHVMNLASNAFTHRITGTYIWSGLGEAPYLFHLDGKDGDTWGYRLEQPVTQDGLLEILRFWKIRTVVNLNRLRYTSKILRHLIRIQKRGDCAKPPEA